MTSGPYLDDSLKRLISRPSTETWKCRLCDFTIPAYFRDAHMVSKMHNAMKRQKGMQIQLVPTAAVDMNGEEIGGQTPPEIPKKKKKKKKKKKNEKNSIKNVGNAGAQTPVPVPLSITPKERSEPRHSASRNSAAGTVECTVVNGAPVIRIISAIPASARIAVPKIEHPPVERSWRTWYSERQERYGYAYPLKQEWWTCPECKWTMYATCKDAHELKKCKPVLAPPRKIKARITPVDVSRGVRGVYTSEERAAQKESYLKRVDARDKKYRYRNLIPTQILSTPSVQIGMWSSMREMRRRREAEIMGREVEDRKREARDAEARRIRAKERREKERKDRERSEREMRAQQMREEMKPQGRNGKKSRGNNSRDNNSRVNNSWGNNSRGDSSRGDNSRGRGNRRRKARGQGGA